MAIGAHSLLRDEIRRTLNSPSLDFFYSPEFSSAQSKDCNDWREKLQTKVDQYRAGKNFSYSISHSNNLGGAAFLDSAEGQIGFDVEVTSRVLSEVALRVSSSEQLKNAPTPAALFVAKEAAFKSLRGPRQPKVLSEVEIIDWVPHSFSPLLYNFTARLKGQQIQWFGVCFEESRNTVGLSVFPRI